MDDMKGKPSFSRSFPPDPLKGFGGASPSVETTIGTYVHSIALGAPIMVAANDATTLEKATARSSGGTVCDGTNDQTDIDDACVAAAGGKVMLSSGTFNIQASITLNDGATIIGQGGGEETYSTRLLMGGNYTITINPTSSGRRWTRLHGLLIQTPQSFNTVALHIQSTKDMWNTHKILDDVCIKAYLSGADEGGAGDLTSGSVGLKLSANASSSISKSSFGHVTICGYEKAFNVLMDGSGSQWKYINGNYFEYLGITYSKYPIFISNTSTSSGLVEFSDNHFQHIDIQRCLSGTNSVDAVTLAGTTATATCTILGNTFDYIMIWDWGASNGKSIVVTGNTTNTTVYYNFFRGRYDITTGSHGVSDDYATTDGYKRYYVPSRDAWTQTPYGTNFFEKITSGYSGGI